MTRLLDARTSQNASYGNTISILLPANTPVAIAELAFPPPPPFDSVISFSIVRGNFDSLVACTLYSVSVSEANPNAVQVVTINPSDYNIPLPPSNELVYTLYLFCTADATRIGIESFNAVAYSD
ncbi:hypothetical protein [Paenibacillus polymyxa]|uniref:hypothetical protein n=1 Tax=Paenibacillus polymyxa TaxID=1406 RepID=UPI0023783AB2|nr:hypothetical protein [Paenibacillus polymyxa]WDM20137.1 hypothetical protein J4I02_13685 [Paenibacillus polymyxa]